MLRPENLEKLESAMKALPPELQAQMRPALQAGNPSAFIHVLKHVHKQLGDFIERYEKKGETLERSSTDSGAGGEQGDPGQE